MKCIAKGITILLYTKLQIVKVVSGKLICTTISVTFNYHLQNNIENLAINLSSTYTTWLRDNSSYLDLVKCNQLTAGLRHAFPLKL